MLWDHLDYIHFDSRFQYVISLMHWGKCKQRPAAQIRAVSCAGNVPKSALASAHFGPIPAQVCAGLTLSVGEKDELFKATEQNKRSKNLKLLAPIFSSASSPSLILPFLTCASVRAFRRQLIGCCGVCVDSYMCIALVYYRCIGGLFYFVPLLMRTFDTRANRGGSSLFKTSVAEHLTLI